MTEILKPETAEILLSTSNDERFPITNIMDQDEKTFWVTTGMYPQEFIVYFMANTYTITKIRTWTANIRNLVIEKSINTQPINFEKLVEVELADRKGQLQKESFQINRSDARFLKFKIESGWDDFASVHVISIEGEKKE